MSSIPREVHNATKRILLPTGVLSGAADSRAEDGGVAAYWRLFGKFRAVVVFSRPTIAALAPKEPAGTPLNDQQYFSSRVGSPLR